jgi:hypothetical protein
MKKLLSLVVLIILAFSAFAPAVVAQDTVSAACTGVSLTDSAVPASVSGDFLAGETITVNFAGLGDFTVNINGVDELVGAVDGASFVYVFPDDGTYTINITVVNGDATSLVSASCTGAEVTAPAGPPYTICHFPPGNPENAHTITVGSENAMQTHVDKHGDTLGACPDAIDTKIENVDLNIFIFVEPLDGVIKVYSDCDDETCHEETIIDLVALIDFSLVVDEEGNFIEVEESILFGEETEEGTSVVIYYLHPNPDDLTQGVFQINIYVNGVLVDDDVLLFINAEGIIVEWTDHSVWDLEDEGSDD